MAFDATGGLLFVLLPKSLTSTSWSPEENAC
jgi:hypothetical protein